LPGLHVICSLFSARLQTLFQQLEKVGGKAAKNQSGDDLQQIRYITLKIFQIITTQGMSDTIAETPNNFSLQILGLQSILHSNMFIDK